MRYSVIFIISLACCFALQSMALHQVGGRTAKSESNFFSSIARIQSGTAEPVTEVFLVGSSLTGRFPSRSEEFPQVSNLGCDGGSSAVVMRAMDEGILPVPKVLVIEGNTLYREQGGGEGLLGGVMRSPWFSVGRRVPNLSATARPAAFAYSLLLERKVGSAEGGEKKPLTVDAVPMVPTEALEPLPEKAQAVVAEMAGIMARLQAKGCKMIIVQLPPGADAAALYTRIPYALSKASGVPILDLAKDLPKGAVRYTDGVHMAPASAAGALRSIMTAVESL